jgi:hypothetical protein
MAALLAAVVIAAAPVAGPPPTAGAAAPLPATGDCPDPTVLEGDGGYVALCTNVITPGVVVNVPALVSDDATTWRWRGDALPELGVWATPGFTWSPGAAYLAGTWTLYYSALHTASGRQCIGVATGSAAAGPYRDTRPGPLVCEIREGGSIDPDVVLDRGVPHLVWKTDANAIGRGPVIRARRLTADGTGFVGRTATLLRRSAAWEAPSIEQPAMVPAGKRWILTYSANRWDSDRYATGYAVCRGPLGPCTKRTTRGPAFADLDPAVVGEGSVDFFGRDGRTWMVFHGWDATAPVGYAEGGARILITRDAEAILGQLR